MKKTISLDSRKAGALVLVLALGMVTEVANADFTFGTPTNLGSPVNSAYGERSPSISADGLELYFYDWQVARPGGYGNVDLWVATRATKDDLWKEPVNLGPLVNSSARDQTPDISADGLSLYFASDRPGGYGNRDIWVTTRATTSDLWGEPVNLGPTVNSSGADRGPSISTDGLSLFFHAERSGGSGSRDILVTTRETTDDEWGTPVNLGPIVNSSIGDSNADISADGLWLFFQSSSSRPVWSGEYDLWATTRNTINDEWGTPVNLGPTVNSSDSDDSPDISADGSTLFFSSNDRPGGVGDSDLWQVSIEPIVDLNGDGIVDAADMSIMVDYWGTDEPLCDIGPMPWGDGIVDVQDLIVLAEHLFEATVVEQTAGKIYTPHNRHKHLGVLDTITGMFTDVGNFFGLPEYTIIPAMAFGSDGTLYGLANRKRTQSGLSQLVKIDRATAQVTPVGFPNAINLIAFDIGPDGTAYVGGFNKPANGWIGDTNLYRIDTTTGELTLIGDTGVDKLMDFAFDSSGTMWGTVADELYVIDTSTGAAEHVVTITGVDTVVTDPAAEIMGIMFDENDVLYATVVSLIENSPLLIIDTVTGQATVAALPEMSVPHGGDIFVDTR